ncbi:MAG: ABC1 kinase family protein [Lewinella sp.]|uniref:ABC1 kinase family protein n=1 Tax=Lewinella sp. TaxID=2004506 RepID=UPI003D6C234C
MRKPNKLLHSPGKRTRRAYSVAARVGFSYLWLYWRKKIFGQAYYDRRIMVLHQKNATRVKTAVLELQGLFIKVGQLLSILTNFLPEAFQEPLESLQDQVPARPYEQVKQRVVTELGADPEQLFATFSKEPLAAASIGQAHRAQLKSGEEVVVKVQHLDIESVAEVDLKIIQRLQSIMSWWFNIQGMEHLYTQVRQMIEEELDFVAEARAMQEIAENLKEEEGVVIPIVFADYSTARVMTTAYQAGVKINKKEQLDNWGVDQEALARKILRVYSRMVFKDGYYHADPHPGNLLVQADSTLVILDFGAVARLQPVMREGLSELIEAAVKNDLAGMVEAGRKMGFLAAGREAERMAEQMIDAMRTFIQQEIKLEGLDFKNIEIDPFNNSLFELLKNIGIGGITSTVQVPKEYVLLNRMATLLLGISSTLAPQLNPLDVVRPYVQKFVLGEKGNLVSFVTRVLRDTTSQLLSIPGELQGVLRQARQGQLDIASVDTRNSGRLVYQGLRQLSLTLLLITGAAFCYLFWKQSEEVLLQISGGACLVFGYLLWRSGRKAKRVY